jgi:hypothetical protein
MNACAPTPALWPRTFSCDPDRHAIPNDDDMDRRLGLPFRLSCLLLQRRTVTPYFFQREKRPSTPIEIDTTAHIRQAFFAGMPTNMPVTNVRNRQSRHPNTD